jgi:hypothetical protein
MRASGQHHSGATTFDQFERDRVLEVNMRRAVLMGLSTMLMLGAAMGQSPAPTNDQPSLADLAAKQKKAKAKKVITNEDIPERPADSTPSTGSSGGGTAAGSASGAGDSGATTDEKTGKGKAKGEKAADPEAIAAAQTKLDNLKHDEEAMTNGVKKIEDLIANGDDFRKNMMADTLQHQKDNLADTQKKRQAAEDELNKLKNPKKQ